jgi:glycosyltransferase involved in cell wall biosynthesis
MFSIVIPLHNKRHTIAGTVRSVLGQSFEDYELIIVDDGSTDGGLDVLAGIADPRLRMVRQDRAGPGPARNAGIEAARHDWIAFLDADDVWLSCHLAELDRIRTLHPEAGLIGASFVRSDPEGRYVPPADGESRIGLIPYLDRFADGGNVLCASSAAVHRRVYRSLGGFADFPRGADTEYWVRIALAWPVAASSRVTAIYMRGTGGISETNITHWFGRELRRTGDLTPSVALLLDRLPEISSPDLRRAIDGYIDRYFYYCVRESAHCRDLRTLRALPRLYRRWPPIEDVLVVGAAFLPAPLADAVYRLGYWTKGMARRLRARIEVGAGTPKSPGPSLVTRLEGPTEAGEGLIH